MAEMQTKYPVKHSGITHTKEEMGTGCCPAWVPFQRSYSKIPCVLLGSHLSSAQDTNSQLRSQAFSVRGGKDHWKLQCATPSGFPPKGSMAWQVPTFSLASILALSIFPNNLILIANKSQISLEKISLGKKQLPVRYLISLGPSGV